jgi:hypothetical protein
MQQTERTPELPTAYRGKPNLAPPPEQTECPGSSAWTGINGVNERVGCRRSVA